MARVILMTGGNRGEMKPRLHKAQEMINTLVGPVLRCSHRYKSAAWGFPAQEPFTNQALIADTDLTPRQVLECAHQIEAALGRDRAAEEAEKQRTGEPYASRVVDIDILFYDDLALAEPDLVIPHPLLHLRDFVLEPLHEIAPGKVHPVLGKTIDELWNGRGEKKSKVDNE